MEKCFYVRTIKSGWYAVYNKEKDTYSMDENYKRGKKFKDVKKADRMCNYLNKTFDNADDVFEVVQEVRRSKNK